MRVFISYLFSNLQALKQMTINAAPNVLVLHLKRFSYGGSSGKMNKKIDFEIQLDVPCNGESSTSSLFNLIGIVVHHGGSIHSGHYVAFVKVSDAILLHSLSLTALLPLCSGLVG